MMTRPVNMMNTAARVDIGYDKGERYPSPVYVYGFSKVDGPCDHIASFERLRTDPLHTGRMRRQAWRIVGMAYETWNAKAPF